MEIPIYGKVIPTITRVPFFLLRYGALKMDLTIKTGDGDHLEPEEAKTPRCIHHKLRRRRPPVKYL